MQRNELSESKEFRGSGVYAFIMRGLCEHEFLAQSCVAGPLRLLLGALASVGRKVLEAMVLRSSSLSPLDVCSVCPVETGCTGFSTSVAS